MLPLTKKNALSVDSNCLTLVIYNDFTIRLGKRGEDFTPKATVCKINHNNKVILYSFFIWDPIHVNEILKNLAAEFYVRLNSARKSLCKLKKYENSFNEKIKENNNDLNLRIEDKEKLINLLNSYRIKSNDINDYTIYQLFYSPFINNPFYINNYIDCYYEINVEDIKCRLYDTLPPSNIFTNESALIIYYLLDLSNNYISHKEYINNLYINDYYNCVKELKKINKMLVS